MPTRPPNLQITYRYTGTTLLDPLIVYETAVYFLSHYCIYGWDQPVPGIPFRRPSSPIGFSVQQTREASRTPLRISSVFFALLGAMSRMSEQEFRALDVFISISNRLIGVLRIFQKDPGGILSIDSPFILPPTSPSPNASLNVGANSGIYIDPGNKYAIPYTFSPPPVPSGDIFTAIISAIVIITHAGTGSRFDSLYALSVGGNLALRIQETSPPDTEKAFAISVVNPLLEKITTGFVMLRRFETLKFAYEEVQPDGASRRKLLEGYFEGVVNAANGQKDDGDRAGTAKA
ncbi:MAG: hypothetical protein LQ339_005747 [Xanthoria mediterranea]|nr:MAG: hypothetical protein LQ339_005747 [Xanthoria mediterranea]